MRIPVLASALALTLTLTTAAPALANCDFRTGLHREALADIAAVRRIVFVADDYRKWARNGLRIITSGGEQILERFKRKHDGRILVEYDFGRCEFPAEVRQNGDFKDHVDFSAGRLLQSLNVKLNEGNVAGAVRFKLLLGATRNADNEVLGTLLLRELGFLAPRTRVVNVVQNGAEADMLWQESASKEFLEVNGRREGPILEGDEALLASWSRDRGYALEDLALARLVNDKWAARGPAALAMAADAFTRLQRSYAAFGNLHVLDPTRALSALPLPRTASREAAERWWSYSAAMLAMRASHGLRPHNRKFYWNAFLQGFEPIYYDGEIDIARPEPRYLRARDRDLFLTSITPPMIWRLEDRLAAIDAERFARRYAELCGARCDPGKAQDFLTSFATNLAGLSRQLYPRPEAAAENPMKAYAARLFGRVDDARTLSFEAVDWANGTTRVKVCDAARCDIEERPVASLLAALSGLDAGPDATEAAIAAPLGAATEITTLRLDRWAMEVRHSAGARVAVEPAANAIRLIQSGPLDWFLLHGGTLDGVEVIFEGVAAAAAPADGAQRFNAFGLTGCVTFHDVVFAGTTVRATGGGCEDTVNLVGGRGRIAAAIVADAMADALDVDFSDLSIDRIVIARAGNDCVDLSGGSYAIGTLTATGCGDKAASVGEASTLHVDRLVARDVGVGVASKDSSAVSIGRLAATGAGRCYEVYRKKQEFHGALLQVDRLACQGAGTSVDAESQFHQGES